MNKSLTIVVPTYNEEGSLPGLIPNLMGAAEDNNWEVIFVNDCSVDNTAQTLSEFSNQYSFKIIHNKVNLGYGGAIKKGILAANTDLVITFDADGQHKIEDIKRLYEYLLETDADMIVGSRKGQRLFFNFRGIGKFIIRIITKIAMQVKIRDINSGMKIYNTNIAKKYLDLCPDAMAYSDIITLTFIHQKHLVLELPITVNKRTTGKSTISINSAFQTIIEVLNIAMLFNPLRLLLPVSITCFLFGLIWGLQFIIQEKGLSVGALSAIIIGLIFFFLGLLAEQLSHIRRK